MGFDEVRDNAAGAARKAKERFSNGNRQNQSSQQDRQNQGDQNQNRQDQNPNFADAQRGAQDSGQRNSSFADRADQGIDNAAGAVNERTGNRAEGQVRDAADRAKNRIPGNNQ